MKKELKSGILSADKSADCRPTVGGANVIAVLVLRLFDQIPGIVDTFTCYKFSRRVGEIYIYTYRLCCTCAIKKIQTTLRLISAFFIDSRPVAHQAIAEKNKCRFVSYLVASPKTCIVVTMMGIISHLSYCFNILRLCCPYGIRMSFVSYKSMSLSPVARKLTLYGF